MPLSLLSRFRSKEIPITGTDLVLKPPQRGDYGQWIKLRTESASFLTVWEPKWPRDDLTPIGFRRRLRSYSQQRNTGTGHVFFLHGNSGKTLLGGLNLTKITYGDSRSATLGYWMGVNHAGKGNIGKTIPTILSFAFNDLKLKRVEAAALPGNARSIHLLEKYGFQREGYAREYLEINGTREDHILFGRLPHG